MNPEETITALTQRVKDLEDLINNIIYPDRFQFDLSVAHKGNKLGFYSVAPVIQPSSGVGRADLTGSGGTAVTTNQLYTGNTGIGTTGYGIGDIVYNLKLLGLLKK